MAVIAIFAAVITAVVIFMPSADAKPPAGVSRPAPTPALEPIPKPDPRYAGGSPLDAGEVERYIVEFTNEMRETEGLHPLTHDPAASRISRQHSTAMAESGIFSHKIDGDGPIERARKAGYGCPRLSENIASTPRVKEWTIWTWKTAKPALSSTIWRPTSYWHDDRAMAYAVVDQWMDSPGHRENLLDPEHRRIGVGIHIQESPKHGYANETVYATQNFSSCK